MISNNQYQIGVDVYNPAAAHITGTSMGDRRCSRTSRGTRDPIGTAPTRLANSWKMVLAANLVLLWMNLS